MMKARVLAVGLLWLVQTAVCFAAEPPDPRGVGKGTKSDIQTISEATYRKLFLDYVCSHLGKDESEVIVSRFKVWGDKPLPSGKVAFHLFQKDKGGFERQVRLTAVASVNGNGQNEVQLSGWVDVFGSVLCASRSLKKGTMIKEGDVMLVKRNLSQFPSSPLTDPKQATGLMVRQSIPENAALREGMLEKPPVLRKGDKVTILVERDGLRLRAPGKALELGHRGEVIKIENAMSSKEIYARVIDSSTVTVDF